MDIRRIPIFQHVRWNPDARELRRFAISMLVGFALLGLLAAWRRHSFGTPNWILWGIGLALAAAALSDPLLPGLGRAAYLAVYLSSSVVGYLVSSVVLALLFFLVFVPIGAVMRLSGKDPLRLRPQNALRWIHRNTVRDRGTYYRQF
jgi:hypothetical protein